MSRGAMVLAVLLLSCRGRDQPEEQAPAPPPTATGGGLADLKVPDVQYSSAPADIERGKELFTQKGCNACHKLGGGKLVGPDLKGVTARRERQWITKMILRPDLMVKEDPAARELLKTHLTPMPNQGIAESDLMPLLSYLKANE